MVGDPFGLCWGLEPRAGEQGQRRLLPASATTWTWACSRHRVHPCASTAVLISWSAVAPAAGGRGRGAGLPSSHRARAGGTHQVGFPKSIPVGSSWPLTPAEGASEEAGKPQAGALVTVTTEGGTTDIYRPGCPGQVLPVLLTSCVTLGKSSTSLYLRMGDSVVRVEQMITQEVSKSKAL